MLLPGSMLGCSRPQKNGGKQRFLFNRRNFLLSSGVGLLSLAFGNHQAQREIAVRVHHVLTDTPFPPVIACADMHIGGTGSTLDGAKFERAIEHARAQVLKYTSEIPSICVAGDFVCSANLVAHTTHGSVGDFYDIFGELARKHRIIAALGNHDTKLADWPTIQRDLASSVSFLTQAEKKEDFGSHFQVLGMPDFNSQSVLYTDQFMEQLLHSINTHTGTSFILCHDPDGVDFFEKWCLKNGHKVLQSTLFFCGHTHGGLIGYPVLDRFVAQKTPLHLKSNYVRGTYPSKLGPHVKIVVSVGIGSYLEAAFRYGEAMPTIHAFVGGKQSGEGEGESLVLTK